MFDIRITDDTVYTIRWPMSRTYSPLAVGLTSNDRNNRINEYFTDMTHHQWLLPVFVHQLQQQRLARPTICHSDL